MAFDFGFELWEKTFKVNEKQKKFLSKLMLEYDFLQHHCTAGQREILEGVHATGEYTEDNQTVLTAIRNQWINYLEIKQ
jgi:hypothetical protein